MRAHYFLRLRANSKRRATLLYYRRVAENGPGRLSLRERAAPFERGTNSSPRLARAGIDDKAARADASVRALLPIFTRDPCVLA